MDPREDDPDSAPPRPTLDDLRADYDDEFESRWTPFERARVRVFGPATAFIAIGCMGVLGMIVGAGVLLYQDLGRALNNPRPHVLVPLLVGLFFLLIGALAFSLVIVGGATMMRLRRRGLALLAAYLVTGLSLAGCYGILFYPFGIWGLIVLYRPDVREQFGRRPPPRDDGHGGL